MPEPISLLYDRECGFCRWSVAKLLQLSNPGSLQPVAIQSVEGETLLTGLPPEQRLTSAHAVLGDGTVLSGGRAAPEVALRLRGGQVLKPMAGVSPRLIDFAYQSISSNRSLFGRLLSDKALANAGELIASRTATNFR